MRPVEKFLKERKRTKKKETATTNLLFSGLIIPAPITYKGRKVPKDSFAPNSACS